MRLFLPFLFLIVIYNVNAKKKDRTVVGCQPVYKDRIFIKETEVTNFQYHEFLYYNKMKGNDLLNLLPDTLVWRDDIGYNEPYVEYYFRHPAYRDYPVVGITKEQANQYCKWLSEMLTTYYRDDEKSDIDSVVVRLPTKQEWIDAAKGGNDYYKYPWEGHDLRVTEGKSQGMLRANFVRGVGDFMGIAGSLNDNADVTAPVYSYWPNDFGLYNCAGNVAEMVSDDAVALGGSWRSSGYDIKVTSEINATKASSQIGFRYLVEVVRLKGGETKLLTIDKKYVKKQLVERDSLCFAKHEVSNELFNLFLDETGHLVQDTTIWDSVFIYSNWYTCNYRWHSDYANYPAVGMTKKDALEFCSWMTKKLQPYFDYTIEVDLPTEKEWEKWARGGLDLSPYPWGGPYLRNSKGFLLANYRYIPDAFKTRTPKGDWVEIYPNGRHKMFGADHDGYLGCAPVDAYYSNDYGLYCMSGNVREMVKDSDEFTRGGGWNSYDYFLQNSYREFYETLPQADIGFRFVIRKAD